MSDDGSQETNGIRELSRAIASDEALAYVLGSVTGLHTTGLARTFALHATTLHAFATSIDAPLWASILDNVAAQTSAHLASVFTALPHTTLLALCPFLAPPPPHALPHPAPQPLSLPPAPPAPASTPDLPNPPSPPNPPDGDAGAPAAPATSDGPEWTWLGTEGVRKCSGGCGGVEEAAGVAPAMGGREVVDLFTVLGVCTGVDGVAAAVAASVWAGGVWRARKAPAFALVANDAVGDGDEREQTFVVDAGGAEIAHAVAVHAVALALYAAYMGNVLLHYAAPAFTPVPPELVALYAARGAAPAGSLDEPAAARLTELEATYVTHLMASSADSMPTALLAPLLPLCRAGVAAAAAPHSAS